MQVARRQLITAGFALLWGACAGEAPAPITGSDHALGSRNGLSLNGLSLNGLSLNGLSLNGLSLNGLSTATFSSWFNQNTVDTAMLMSYIVKCALPVGASLTWQNPADKTSYTWSGLLGLAPGWASGKPATLAEQQVISACLGAHANKYGVQINIAVEGKDANGVEIPRAPGELDTYARKEGCFFGNLFNGEGVFVGRDSQELNPVHSSPRACALEAGKTEQECPPLAFIGRCSQVCTPDPTGTYYTQCTYNGITYRPLSTRILPSDVYACGDNTCQFTEKCGVGGTADNCGNDCGRCPSP